MSNYEMIELYKEVIRDSLRQKTLTQEELFSTLQVELKRRPIVKDFVKAFNELKYGDELVTTELNLPDRVLNTMAYSLNPERDVLSKEGDKGYKVDSDYKVMIETIALARYILANSEVDEFHSSMQNVQKECEESLVKEGYSLEQVKNHSIARYKELLKQSK